MQRRPQPASPAIVNADGGTLAPPSTPFPDTPPIGVETEEESTHPPRPSFSSSSSDAEDVQTPSTAPATPKIKEKRSLLVAFGSSLLGGWKPTLTLENSGSVARDHLASERTFLAYVRTSLTIASTGVALVQLFTISAATSNKALEHYSRPIGAIVICIGLATLVLGLVRYFTIQSALVGGSYPVARVSTIMLAVIMSAVIIAVFGIIVGVR
ncbi:hypothetical protein BDW22DRAFT_1417975 [Trametopsis cervina]|nr:hypothetical protein BDW22DRAFT_1417975 [Trametopsis cervina]